MNEVLHFKRLHSVDTLSKHSTTTSKAFRRAATISWTLPSTRKQNFCPNLLKVSTGDPELFQNYEEMEQAADRLRAWVADNISPDAENNQSLLDRAWTTYMQNTDQDVYNYFLPVETTSTITEVPVVNLADQRMQRQAVRVLPGPIANSAIMRLRWREKDLDAASDTHEVTITLAPDTVSHDMSDERYIAFLPRGFNIYNKDDEALGITKGQTYTISNANVELQLRNSGERSAFMRLCQEEEAENEPDDAHRPSLLPAYLASAFAGRSASLYDLGETEAKVEQARKRFHIVQTGDAMYLVEMFLREFFLDG